MFYKINSAWYELKSAEHNILLYYNFPDLQDNINQSEV